MGNVSSVLRILVFRVFRKNTHLVGGFSPFEKYARQIGSSPQVGVKVLQKFHHLVMVLQPADVFFGHLEIKGIQVPAVVPEG